jgi:hypothetical protein
MCQALRPFTARDAEKLFTGLENFITHAAAVEKGD